MLVHRSRRARPSLGLALCAAASFIPGLASAEVPVHSSASIERNPSAATGRAGTATLSARALLDQSGKTLLQLTTGTLDSASTPPGYIAKAQIRNYDNDGKVLSNKTPVLAQQSGYQVFEYPHMHRGQSYEVQTNIRAIDGNRTNVVT